MIESHDARFPIATWGGGNKSRRINDHAQPIGATAGEQFASLVNAACEAADAGQARMAYEFREAVAYSALQPEAGWSRHCAPGAYDRYLSWS